MANLNKYFKNEKLKEFLFKISFLENFLFQKKKYFSTKFDIKQKKNFEFFFFKRKYLIYLISIIY